MAASTGEKGLRKHTRLRLSAPCWPPQQAGAGTVSDSSFMVGGQRDILSSACPCTCPGPAHGTGKALGVLEQNSCGQGGLRRQHKGRPCPPAISQPPGTLGSPQGHPRATEAPEAGKWEQLASPPTGRSETPAYPAHLCHQLGEWHHHLSFLEAHPNLQENQALRAVC